MERRRQCISHLALIGMLLDGGLSLNATLSQVGIAERAFFLIDKEGIVRQRWLIKGGEEVVFPSEPLLKAVGEVVEKP